MNFLNQNIRHLRKENKFTQDEMALKLGVKRPMIGSYEENRAVPKVAVMQKISSLFNVGIDELINTDLSKGFSSVNKAKGSNLRVLSTIVDENNIERISVVPVKASAGYLNGYADPEFVGTLPTFSMPIPELSNERTYRVFQIKGDSMLPIPSGAYIFCEYVLDWADVKDGKPHVLITTDEGVVYKRIYDQIEEKGNLLLKSDNPEYQPYEVSTESILEVWKALGYLSFDLPETSNLNMQNLSNMMLIMQKEIADLKKD